MKYLKPLLQINFQGISKEKVNKRIEKLSESLDLIEFSNIQARNLPNGIARKLCFSMAIIGNPRILLLDDPASGLDPVARRKMWSLLKKRQEERTVLLSSHYVNDANALADYTVILHKGRIKCSGSTEFLLKRYGQGYNLR